MSAGGPFQDRPGLRADSVTLTRGGRLLFEALSFSAPAGMFAELRGPNGSGKTSLLRAFAGLLKPRAGAALVEAAPEPALVLHYLAHLNALKSAANVMSHLLYWRGLLGGTGDVDNALNRVGLDRMARAPARALSQGQARRLALARLLVAPRPIWLLDEPAAALDASGRALLEEMITSHCAAGGVVLAALHEPLVKADLVVDLTGRA